MELAYCDECGGKVSTRAALCPHCGIVLSQDRLNLANSPSDTALATLVLVLHGALASYILWVFSKEYVAGLQAGLASGKSLTEVLGTSARLHSFVAFSFVGLFALVDAADVVKRNRLFPVTWNSRYVIEAFTIGAYFFTVTAFEQRTTHFIPGFAVVLFCRMAWDFVLLREHGNGTTAIEAEHSRFLLHESRWLGIGALVFGIYGIYVTGFSHPGLTAFDIQAANHFILFMVVWWWIIWQTIEVSYLPDGARDLSVLPVPRWRVPR